MTDEQQRTITPEKFLSAAERYQLAPAVDRWVVSYVLKLLTPLARPLADKGARFAVNISGQSLGDESFIAFLDTELREAQIPPQILAFELTETAAVANIVRAEALIRRLRDLGFEVALDDFGRGLSSLGYLKTLPVTSLKIDSSLVRDIAGDSRSQAMLSAIVQLARAIGPQDRGGRRRNGGDPPDNRPTGRRIRPGVRHRASRSAGRRDRKARRG